MDSYRGIDHITCIVASGSDLQQPSPDCIVKTAEDPEKVDRIIRYFTEFPRDEVRGEDSEAAARGFGGLSIRFYTNGEEPDFGEIPVTWSEDAARAYWGDPRVVIVAYGDYISEKALNEDGTPMTEETSGVVLDGTVDFIGSHDGSRIGAEVRKLFGLLENETAEP